LRHVPPGPESRRLAEKLRRYEAPTVTYLADDFPVFWSEARGANVLDVDENVYIDLTAAFAVTAAGHGHPAIVEAVREQASRLLHGMGDVHPPAIKVELLQRLAEITPGTLSQTILANSGSEAVEAALKTVMLATGKPRVLSFGGSYHGLTPGALAVTGRSEFRTPFLRQLPDTAVFVPYPDSHRTGIRGEPDSGDAGLIEIEQALDRADAEGAAIGGIIAEPIQGRGGEVVPPDGWLTGLRRICDRRGLVLVLDEVYTGFGRTGRWFACEHWGVVPDILVVGKALTGGLPFAACIGTEAVMSAWPRSRGEALHTSTFLGHPLGCAAALASIRVIEEEGLVERAAAEGEHVMDRLRRALIAHPRVGQIRGLGLMIGIELVEDVESRTPSPDLAGRLVVESLRRGVLVLAGGVHGNVLSLSPPLSIEREQLDYGIGVILELLAESG
jgi:4-aminobutyrate aminotransferase/(S)-3-amino-2-methylpropionate transaminase